MSQSQKQIRNKSRAISKGKLAFFMAYCGAGIVSLGFFTFRCIKIRNDYNDGNNYARGRIFQSPVFRKMVMTGIGLTFGFLIGMGYLIKSIKPADVFLKQAIQMSKLYTDTIQLDPVYQDYHIFQMMEYFRVSKELILRTQEQFREIQNKLKAEGKYLKPQQQSLQRQFIKLVLKKEAKYRSVS